MCMSINYREISKNHIIAYKSVRRENGQLWSRYAPIARTGQDSFGFNSITCGKDWEYKIGSLMVDPDSGFYLYLDLSGAERIRYSRDHTVLEVLIPRGTQCLFGNSGVYEAVIAKEIIVLKEILAPM